ncbi:hypothetical protein L0Y81_30105 (plasmid) [Burkholderia multivorans]|uniref:Uncharacterized protein n=2 Tax=Burkholderia multivorans TaxID=87883 RepID=A0A0H3KWH5_BURM1|nr:hypothetical protein [Burkholderia multivorans]MBR8048169.1 hypothetical protein [Burkholderia multivorans]MBR8453300.1 hypothetical protein [Burkholderia multivorans]MBU9526019.1 hypothetical protein [Burkholderia multivorans]MCA8224680.1 hypothetical protein [Burkholderia multivorans]MCL4647410.1 hypothetical protein [Burkholderia multivorans]
MMNSKRANRMLADGEYEATCRERTIFSAAANGHSAVFPRARMVVKNGCATFTRDGAEVWNCNARYAAAHFDVQRIPHRKTQ